MSFTIASNCGLCLSLSSSQLLFLTQYLFVALFHSFYSRSISLLLLLFLALCLSPNPLQSWVHICVSVSCYQVQALSHLSLSNYCLNTTFFLFLYLAQSLSVCPVILLSLYLSHFSYCFLFIVIHMSQ